MPQVACPVCTLYLREGMSLSKHLHTHPKAQVIAALARLAGEEGDESMSVLLTTRINYNSQKVNYPQLEPAPPPPPPQLTSILYHQQFLSSTTTRFVDPSCLPPPPQLIMMAPANRLPEVVHSTASHLNPPVLSFMNTNKPLYGGQTSHTQHTVEQFDLINVGNNDNNVDDDGEELEDDDDDEEEEGGDEEHVRCNNSAIEQRESPTFQYPQLDNLNFQRHTQQNDDENPIRNQEEDEVENEVMNIGTVITDSQKIISNNSPLYLERNSPGSARYAQADAPAYLEQNAPGRSPVYLKQNAPDRSPVYLEQNAPGRSPVYLESTAPGSSPVYLEQNAPGRSPVYLEQNKAETVEVSPNSPGSSSCYSVRVRRDLRTPSCSPPRNEYIVPGFEFDGDDDDNNSDVVDDSGLSVPLNIHTDESMPPRGELSGHGTNSSSMWQTQEINLQPNGTKKQTTTATTTTTTGQSWRNGDGEDEGGMHILPDSQDGISVIRREQRHSQHSLIQFSSGGIGLEGGPAQEIRDTEPFSSVFIQPKKEQVKEEAGTIKLDDIKEDADAKKEFKRRIRTCRTCNETFPTSEEFTNHIKRVHPLECKACGKCFMRASGLTLHQKRHLKVKPYRCNYCEKAFVTNQKLNEHHNTHTGNSPFKCTNCPRTFKRYSNLIQHKKNVHLKLKRKPKDYFCDCGEVFNSELKLAWHREKHDGQPKKCSYCSSRFVHTASLTRHIRKSHDQHYIPVASKLASKAKVKENVECPICQKVCLKASLKNHLLVHSGVRPFGCTSCGKRFFSKWNMKLHMWTHATRSSMPYKCSVLQCKASFVRENDLNDHLRAHKNQRQYSCNYCGRQFLRKSNCLRHTREHEEDKRYKCNVCGKKFHRGYYLTEHMRIHTGAKPFTCHICSKTTASKTNHNKHLKTHHAREIIASEN